jgi:hypothetical protein
MGGDLEGDGAKARDSSTGTLRDLAGRALPSPHHRLSALQQARPPPSEM